jgi:predicted RNA-binding protein Jag
MNASVDDVKEFVAENREAALAMAAGHFRTSEDQLETWVVPPTIHISGLGDRVLLIAALRSERSSRAAEPRREERRDERRDGGRGGRDRDRDRDRGGRDRDRGDRDRGRERRSFRGNGEDEAPRRTFDRAPAAAEAAEEPAPAATVRSELGQVGVFVAGLVERMGLREVAVTEAETEDGEIVITLAGRAISGLVDRDPRVIAALSHLAHRAAEALLEEGASAHVLVKGARRPREEGRDRDRDRPQRDGRRDRREGRDGRGDRSSRGRDSDDRDIDEAELERLAKSAAKSVRETGESELLPPMNSRERWFIHNALKDERGVRSESEGEGARKRVKIFPA